MPSIAGSIAIVGAGKIGEALLGGLLAGGVAAADLTFTERYPARAAQLTAAVRRPRPWKSRGAAGAADVVVVAVKPQDIEPVLADLGEQCHRRNPRRVAVCWSAHGALRAQPARRAPVVRVMPNTPMLVGEAMSAISAGTHATDDHLQIVEDLLATVGKVVRVPESQQDAVTALSGSGPAYFFFLVEAMIDAGILLGLPRNVAAELIIQSAVGSAKMLRESGEHPVMLREAVTSPGGTTIAAIRELEKHGVRAALLAAIEAAAQRSAELGRAHQ